MKLTGHLLAYNNPREVGGRNVVFKDGSFRSENTRNPRIVAKAFGLDGEFLGSTKDGRLRITEDYRGVFVELDGVSELPGGVSFRYAHCEHTTTTDGRTVWIKDAEIVSVHFKRKPGPHQVGPIELRQDVPAV